MDKTCNAVSIAGREIGPEAPPYVIAELSANHNGSLEQALAIMTAAKEAGADAIKLQTYTPDTMTIACDEDDFLLHGTIWEGKTLYDLYVEAHTPWEWHEALFAKGKELGITVFSTPFDETAVDFLEGFDPPAYKIASFELIDIPLLTKVAATGRPLIVSTGMASMEEIGEAVSCVREAGCTELVLLHCVSGYPTPPEDANLRTIPDLADKFGVTVGLSDHTLSTEVAFAAIGLGACVIEKHFTMRRTDGGPDSTFSIDPPELRTLCNGSRVAWQALGEVNYSLKESEKDIIQFRRSLYVVEDMAAGDAFTRDNLRVIRPGHGLPPKDLGNILTRRAKVALKRGTPLSWDVVA